MYSTSFILLMCIKYYLRTYIVRSIIPINRTLYMLRSQAIKASANLTRTLGLMFKLNKHVDLIAAKFAADFLD